MYESSIYFTTGKISTPDGSAHRLTAPYQAFKTKDGYINIGAANQSNWERLTKVLGMEKLNDNPDFSDSKNRQLNKVKLEKILEEVGLACNKNAIPYDPNPPKVTSGLRFGTAAATTRGFNQEDFKQVGNMIADILDSLLLSENERQEVFNKTRNKVIEICSKYPIYDEAF